MIDIEEFYIEITPHRKVALYQDLIECFIEGRTEYHFLMNRFGFELNFQEDKAVVYDDLFPEKEIVLSIKEFYQLIKDAPDK